MSRKTEILRIKSVSEIPTIESIRTIPREKTIKLVFENLSQKQRETIGENLKKNLCGFQVGVHLIKPEINIVKLITDSEIEEYQDFFENCAKDYRRLGSELIYKLADKYKITIDPDFPLGTFNELKSDEGQIGEVDGWRYFLHGFHCGFENIETHQQIEVSLVFSLEFGDLDPYFFTNFIKSTSSYKPLPVEIYEDYAEGIRINDKMLSLGKFERINSNVGSHYGIVVTDREKVVIKEFKGYDIKNEKRKFSFFKFFGLKKS